MSEAPAEAPLLSDFFAKKTKKKIKGSNLNNSAAPAKAEAKKLARKDAEEEGWEEEEQVVVAALKVEVAGKLTRDEDVKEQDDTAAPAWNTLKNKGESSANLNEKRYPTLAKSIRQSTNINVDDGSDAKINIETSKNAFSALETAHDSDEDELRMPKEIKPALVKKAKGERETVAIAREVNKYTAKKAEAKKKQRREEGIEEDSEEEEEDEEPDEKVETAATEVKTKKKKKTEDKKDEKAPEREPEEEDVKIVPDLVAAKQKYNGRKKLPPAPIPREELEEEKKETRQASTTGSKKKKAKGVAYEEDMYEKKLVYLDD
eukprot:CAMPEP_0117538626 /NCGR_PEP_ID=MMETSP0784-20121206/42575_1 /TAXON_ID=39447 /ORGANISM="" /LENGTH=317 /DNA_ID=CAMNT_0005335245 /DNA_START=55 /DNA_END=1008 /DNA_ORIENTATION=+